MLATKTLQPETVIKRDGQRVSFDQQRISDAVQKAMQAAGELDQESIAFSEEIALYIKELPIRSLAIDQIQNLIEERLMDSRYKESARRYIIYRRQRDVERERESKNIKTFNEIVEVEDTNLKNENANINGNTPAGQMMKFASITTQNYALDYLLYPEHAQAHKSGEIHIHDLDYYPTRSLTCVHHDLIKLYENGFNTMHGHIRNPKSIETYAALAAISLQMAQNEMHGGQSIPAFDFFMAKGVKASFKKNFFKFYEILEEELVKPAFEERFGSVEMDNQKLKTCFPKVYRAAYKETKNNVDQAMKGFIYNVNSMHSRGGGQVVFSSINYGTDTSPEGRMVMHSILDATERGLGKGETPIFPIQIFKLKNGVSYDEEDFWKAFNNPEAALAGEIEFKVINFDLFIKSCYVASRRLFPTFLNLDAPFNYHEKWDVNDPERWRYEVATMGCRTRVFNDIHGEKTSISRGNLSFTTVNLVRPAIIAKSVPEYFVLLEKAVNKAAVQLHARYEFQCKAKAKQFPFLVGMGLWKNGENLSPENYVKEVLKHGTLSIGFIGLAEALVALIGKHHGESEEAQALGLSIVGFIRDKCDEYTKKYNLNFTCLATPAEGLSGRFTAIDRKEFGIIPGVTDKDYYTNSSHVPVYYPITAFNKIKIEAPYHKLCNAGHILYVEADGQLRNNLPAYMKIIREMYLNDFNYGAVNTPVDRCLNCSHEGEIEEKCPVCSEEEMIDRIRRITGYLVGNLSRWNSYKRQEEKDRVKHTVPN